LQGVRRRRAPDGQQEIPEILAHALDGGRVGVPEQALLGGGADGEDSVGVPLPGLGQGDQDLTPVCRVGAAADPALLLQPATRLEIAPAVT
jgi:hypothetical protein